jgi:hypothetical protein
VTLRRHRDRGRGPADFLYQLRVLLTVRGVSIDRVIAELRARHAARILGDTIDQRIAYPVQSLSARTCKGMRAWTLNSVHFPCRAWRCARYDHRCPFSVTPGLAHGLRPFPSGRCGPLSY